MFPFGSSRSVSTDLWTQSAEATGENNVPKTTSPSYLSPTWWRLLRLRRRLRRHLLPLLRRSLGRVRQGGSLQNWQPSWVRRAPGPEGRSGERQTAFSRKRPPEMPLDPATLREPWSSVPRSGGSKGRGYQGPPTPRKPWARVPRSGGLRGRSGRGMVPECPETLWGARVPQRTRGQRRHPE